MNLSTIANTIQSDITIKIVVSFLLGFLILVYYKKFLFWIPFLPYSGIWAYSQDNPEHYMFVNSYIEFLLVTFFMIWWFRERKERMSIGLFFMIMLAIPSFLNSKDHIFLSLFLFICLSGGAGVYSFFLKNMKSTISSGLIDKTVLIWIILGILIKFYITGRMGESVILQRGGGILGSNHVAGILFLLLPLVQSQLLALTGIVFLMIQFSRGIYIALAVYTLAWMFLVSARQAVKWLLVICLTMGFFSLISSAELVGEKGQVITFSEFLILRFRTADPGLPQVIERWKRDIRFNLQKDALTIAQEVEYTGIGFGGFRWSLRSLGYPNEVLFSHPHNMFLTTLVEGGLIFALAFAGFVIYLLVLAYNVSKPAFVGLLTWTFYGLLGGEIYEVGGFATAGDYYYLMFVVAFLVYQRREKMKPNLPLHFSSV